MATEVSAAELRTWWEVEMHKIQTKQHWTWKQGGDKPKRQIPHKEHRHNEPEKLYRESDGIGWRLQYRSDDRPIILFEDLSDQVYSSRQDKDSQVKMRKLGKEMSDKYWGVSQTDVVTILQGLQSMNRQYRIAQNTLSASTPSQTAAPTPFQAEESQYPSAHQSLNSKMTSTERANWINQQQKVLRDDPRGADWVRSHQGDHSPKPNTSLSYLTPLGIYVLSHPDVSAASMHQDTEQADFVVMNSEELNEWIEKAPHSGRLPLIVLRDKQFHVSRHPESEETMRSDLGGMELIDYQDYGDVAISAQHAKHLTGTDAQNRFQNPTEVPVNLLNLACNGTGLTPWPIARHGTMLEDTMSAVRAWVKLKAFPHESEVGKQKIQTVSRPVDMETCSIFKIFGQAKSISGWHEDNTGVWTFITVEPQKLPTLEEIQACRKSKDPFFAFDSDKEVLKYWPFIRLDHLSKAEREEAQKGFEADGMYWKPKPHWIRILSLIAGDTLIMPPGTAHAPITVTNCLCRGGMFWVKGDMNRSIEAWKYQVEHPDCTNESNPLQGRDVIEVVRENMKKDPKGHGIREDDELERMMEACSIIAKGPSSCICRGDNGGCKTGRCSCRALSRRCAYSCHKTNYTACKNPFGCYQGPNLII